MKIDEALDKTSINLAYVIKKIEEVEESENMSNSDKVLLKTLKNRIFDCSIMIVSISDNKSELNKDYIAYEIKASHKFCNKTLKEIEKIEDRTRIF